MRTVPSAILLVLSSCGLLAFLLAACPGGSQDGGDAQAQPPVIVVQAPPDSVAQSYAGGAWQTPAGAATEQGAEAGPDSEPYEMIALLREFDPHLTDAPKDQAGEAAMDDLLSAFAVMDDAFLYARMVGREPMAKDGAHETRFWIEQGPAMVTVEVKVGTRDRPCELGDVKTPEIQKTVVNCFWAGNALDLRIPLDTVPPSIDTTQPYWVSGFQTCCSDAERNNPYDEIDGAQEVWRVPQQAVAPAAPGSVGADATPAPAGDTL